MRSPAAEKGRTHRGTAIILDLPLERTESLLSKPAHESVEYKKYSLAARYWGGIPLSAQPMRRVAPAEAQATFLKGLLDTPMDHPEKNLKDWLISVALHVVIVGAVVIAPLAFTQAIDLRTFQLTYLTMPKPPAAPAPPPPALQQVLKRVIRPTQSALVAPTLIPKRIEMIKDPPAPEIDSAGVIGGIPGGETGGVLGGILGGTERGPAPPAAPATKKTVYRVGGDVKPPRQITVVEPSYPPIARQARVEGVVAIDAIIDEHGNVVEARAVSGPGLLIPAALKAVIQWKYEPTYLDGTPVAIRMEVQVYFHLR